MEQNKECERDINHELIELVHKHPYLYDKSSKSYRDNLKKSKSWESITREFNETTGCNVTSKKINCCL